MSNSKFIALVVSALFAWNVAASVGTAIEVKQAAPVIQKIDAQIKSEWKKFGETAGLMHCTGPAAQVVLSHDTLVEVKDVSFKGETMVVTPVDALMSVNEDNSIDISYQIDGQDKQLSSCVPAKVYNLVKAKERIINKL